MPPIEDMKSDIDNQGRLFHLVFQNPSLGRAMDSIDGNQHLAKLVGRTIRTYSGRPNVVLAIEGDSVIVGTERSPRGAPVPIDWVQDALDRLMRDREVDVSVESLGYRSAFIGAVLLMVPGARRGSNPARIVLEGP
jgi:hypothetical protein